MSGHPTTSPRLAVLFAVLRAASGRELSGPEIARRMAKRGQYTLALHSDIHDLRASHDLSDKGLVIPPARCHHQPGGARHYFYRLESANEKN